MERSGAQSRCARTASPRNSRKLPASVPAAAETADCGSRRRPRDERRDPAGRPCLRDDAPPPSPPASARFSFKSPSLRRWAAMALASASRPRRTSRVCKRISRSRALSKESGICTESAETPAQQIGAAALSGLNDAEGLKLANDLAHRGAADRQAFHELAFGRQAVAGLEAGPRYKVGHSRHHAAGAIRLRQRFQAGIDFDHRAPRQTVKIGLTSDI